jgi:Peptidase family M48
VSPSATVTTTRRSRLWFQDDGSAAKANERLIAYDDQVSSILSHCYRELRRATRTESCKSVISMSILLRALAGCATILCLYPQVVWAETSSQVKTWETQFGQNRYTEYLQRGEVVPPESPLYRTLDPIGEAIAAVADREYFAPFHFVLLNEETPNAFSMPGGNVYVTTALLWFLKNRDELAGVICHEVNHDIHHDMYTVFQARQAGRSPRDPSAISYERAAETNADRAGAYLCAKAGFNPWGWCGTSGNTVKRWASATTAAWTTRATCSAKRTSLRYSKATKRRLENSMTMWRAQRRSHSLRPRNVNIRRTRNIRSSINPIRRHRPLPVIRPASSAQLKGGER